MNTRILYAFFALCIATQAINAGELPRQRSTSVAAIAQNLKADVLSPATLKDILRDIQAIERYGTTEQKTETQTLIDQNSQKLKTAIHGTVLETFTNPEVLTALKQIAMGTVYGVLPAVGLKALSILSGNLDVGTASTQLLDLGVLCALDSLFRYGYQKTGTTEKLTAFQAGALSTAVQGFIGYVGERPADMPLLGKASTPLINGLIGAAVPLFTKELEARGGVPSLLQKLDWHDIAMGPEQEQAITPQQTTLTEFLRDNLQVIVNNKTVRTVVATTVTYAVEGALMGAVMHSLGLGYYDETLPMALGNAMLRGALEGLYHASTNKVQHMGIVQRMQGGLVARSVQQYIATGTAGVGALDIVPTVIQQATSGAINGLVRQAGGWKNTFKSLYEFGTSALKRPFVQ